MPILQIALAILGLIYTGFICSGPIMLTYVFAKQLTCITDAENNCIERDCVKNDKLNKMTTAGVILSIVSMIIYFLKGSTSKGKIMMILSGLGVCIASIGFNLCGPIMLTFVGSTVYNCIKSDDPKCVKRDCIFNVKNGALIILGIIFSFMAGSTPMNEIIDDKVPWDTVAKILKTGIYLAIAFGAVMATLGGVTQCHKKGNNIKEGGCKKYFTIGITLLVVLTVLNLLVSVYTSYTSRFPAVKQILFIYFVIVFGSIVATWGGVTKCYKKRETEEFGGCMITFIVGIVMLVLVCLYYMIMFALQQFF